MKGRLLKYRAQEAGGAAERGRKRADSYHPGDLGASH